MADLFDQIAGDSDLVKLLGDHDNSFVGYVYGMRFDEVLILTNDAWKHAVNGIPHNSFLVAAGFNPEKLHNADIIDKEVLLLRVLEPVSLPQDNDFVRTRIEHHQRRTSGEKLPGDVNDGMDPITHAELQAGGLRCSILGTFYIESGKMRLGSDIENFMTLSRLRAYKPTGNALSMIVNHVNPEVRKKAEEEAQKAGFKKISPITIGTVRYTSTARMHRGQGTTLVDVQIQPTDFLARRTAVLGMTRTGKSNTVKTTVSAVALAAMTDGIKVGQLIFDVNGEYANATHQDDDSSIADVFPEQTVRYRAIDTPGFEDLRTNFYLQCAESINLINRLTKDNPYRSQQDLLTFLETSLEKPDGFDEMNRWLNRVAVYQCILSEAGYDSISPAEEGKPRKDLEVRFSANQNIITAIDGHQNSLINGGNLTTNDRIMPNDLGKGKYSLIITKAVQWFLFAREVHYTIKNGGNPIGLPSSTAGKSWVDPNLEAFLNVLARKNVTGLQIQGWRAIVPFTDYHTPKRQHEVVQEITSYLDNGKIVILDLSAGPVEIRKVLSTRIASQIFERQMSIMNKGEIPQNVVIYVEEAHNLIGKDAKLTDTWPRMAKEGAKARIAFVYATQEPSSVHPNILANTENWFVTHLNNDDELRSLGKFYDFGDFLRSLKAAQDVGFARIKTLSSPFVIPTQINRFTPDEIKKKIVEITEANRNS